MHESSHALRASRGFEIGTKADEYMAYRREALFTLGRRPTLAERQTIWNDVVLKRYDNVIDGNVPSFFQRPGF